MPNRQSNSSVVAARVGFSEFLPEIEAIKNDGYEIVEKISLDYERSIGLFIKKENVVYKIMFVECFYDTDKNGKMTKFHGVADIRTTPWSKKIRNKNAK